MKNNLIKFYVIFNKKITFILIVLFRTLISKKYDSQISRWLSFKNWESHYYEAPSLEITTTVGCAMMCKYCPQTEFKTKGASLPKVLSLEVFKNSLSNVPSSYTLWWTGYSESLHNKEFCEMVEYAHQKGHDQRISTTMYGRQHCLEFISTTSLFSSVTFHLPDDNNLMNLKVDQKYLDYLEKTIVHQSKILPKNKIGIHTFGKNFEPKIQKLLNKLEQMNVIQNNQIDINIGLLTRAGQVGKIESMITGWVKPWFKQKKKNETNEDLYFCSFGRLNQGVLLTDGSVSLCCCDYSLEHISGSLINQSIKEIYEHKKLFNFNNKEKNSFLRGNFNPCNRCEFYQKI